MRKELFWRTNLTKPFILIKSLWMVADFKRMENTKPFTPLISCLYHTLLYLHALWSICLYWRFKLVNLIDSACFIQEKKNKEYMHWENYEFVASCLRLSSVAITLKVRLYQHSWFTRFFKNCKKRLSWIILSRHPIN